ncbi:MAG TPA: mismatch-specific DNA-glycosylase [Capillimicrobium sp.]|nr:mismatch-specific DNA-glycosylase [Capillimicrobium sp.]
MSDVLPDVVEPGLRLLLCGSAAGAVAARLGLPYSGPGNRFWRTLHEVGLTPEPLEPRDFRRLPEHGIGLTDLCKTASGADAELPPEADDVDRLRATVARARPEVLAFVGKRAASVALGRPIAAYGAQPDRFADTETWVVPSTSGLAVRWWSVEPWAALAARLA